MRALLSATLSVLIACGSPPAPKPAPAAARACAAPEDVAVKNGASFDRPAGSALRLGIVYQGDEAGLKEVHAFDGVTEPSRTGVKEGVNGGHWVELRGTQDDTLYVMTVRDPSTIEAPSPGGTPRPVTLDPCTPKRIDVILPNLPEARSVVFVASPYGTNEPARTVARFAIR